MPIAAAILCMVSTVFGPCAAQQAAASDEPALSQLLTDYMTTQDSRQLPELQAKIETRSGGDVRVVASELQTLKLWKKQATGVHNLRLEIGWDEPLACPVRVPEGYEPDRAHPLIISLQDERSTEACATWPRDELAAICDPPAIIATPQRIPESSFHAPCAESHVVERFLIELGRRFHIDEDRVYLLGAGTGADAAWQWGLAHPDRFAGLVSEDGYPNVPCAPQLIPLLMENGRGLSMLCVWHASPDLPDRIAPGEGLVVTRANAVAAHNRALAAWAPAAGFAFTGLELAPTPAAGVGSEGRDRVSTGADARPPAEAASQQPSADGTDDENALRSVLAARRPPTARSISHLFRCPQQGRCQWLAQAGFLGDVWTLPQISILPAAGVDRDAFITGVLESKLAYLAGRVQDNTISIDARGSRRIEVLLTDGLIDFDRPVIIICNGKKRYDAQVVPRLSTLLSHARGTWTFRRPVLAKVAFNIDSTAIQE